MMQQAVAAVDRTKQEHASVFGGIALTIGMVMTLATLVAMVGGKMHGWKGGVGMLILGLVPICTLGTGLAIISLIWRKENKKLGQAALWLNGMLAFFAFPLMTIWLLLIA